MALTDVSLAEMSTDERELLLLLLTDEPSAAETLEVVENISHDATNAKDEVSLPAVSKESDVTGNEDKQEETKQNEQKQVEEEAPKRKVNPRRNRKRRKHEVDALRVQLRELSEKLAQLQERVAVTGTEAAGGGIGGGRGPPKNALVATHIAFPREDVGSMEGRDSEGNPTKQTAQWIVISNGKRTSPSAWETLAWTHREQAQAAVTENLRLRLQYESQLQMLRQLEMLYNAHQQQDQMLWGGETMSIPWRQDLYTSTSQLSKRARVDPFDADTAVFAALGRDFDVQHAKVDPIFAAVGLANFEGNLKRGMVPKRGENGIYFLESLHSRLLARDMFANSEQRWSCMARADMHPNHEVFEVREKTHDTMVRKLVSSIRLPNAEATLIRRTAMKRYVEKHRIVFVWDSALEIGGSVSMRLRERGWKMMRKPRVMPPNYDGGDILVEQTCSRITPELWSTYVVEDIAPGSLTNTVVGSYRRHMKQTYFHTMEILAAEFGEMSIRNKYFDKKGCTKGGRGGGCGGGGGGCGGGGQRHHVKKEFWHHGECARPPPAQMMQLVEL